PLRGFQGCERHVPDQLEILRRGVVPPARDEHSERAGACRRIRDAYAIPAWAADARNRLAREGGEPSRRWGGRDYAPEHPAETAHQPGGVASDVPGSHELARQPGP